MTAIWHNDGTTWRLLSPSGFPDEAALHTLVEQAPHILSLAGSPRLTVVGREVALGSGYADLIALEATGRPTVIEVKLGRNAEARRAVVAQGLTYAAYLYGLDPLAFEQTILLPHLHKRGFESLAHAVGANDQVGDFDAAVFSEGLRESLAQGRFRLAIVLDEAPDELSRLAGYLQTVADKLVIDLVTVSSYEVGGARVMVPQRVDAERTPSEATPAARAEPTAGYPSGTAEFIAAIERSPTQHQEQLRRLTDWAIALEREGLVSLSTYRGKSGVRSLLPRLLDDNVGLVTIWNYGSPSLAFWRSVFERRAPHGLASVEQVIAPLTVGQGNTARIITDELLEALTEAYREAARHDRTTGGVSS
jgi:hypothetical protein